MGTPRGGWRATRPGVARGATMLWGTKACSLGATRGVRAAAAGRSATLPQDGAHAGYQIHGKRQPLRSGICDPLRTSSCATGRICRAAGNVRQLTSPKAVDRIHPA
eukprot:6952246-Alexandrium_andersonii.AAC.1